MSSYPTVLRNHNRIVFEEMSSWTELTWYIGMKTAFQTKYMNINIFGLVLRRFKIFRIIEENAYLKKYSTLQQRAHKIGFQCYSNVSMHFRIMLSRSKIIIIIFRTYLLYVYLVYNFAFIPRCIVEAVQDDIS